MERESTLIRIQSSELARLRAGVCEHVCWGGLPQGPVGPAWPACADGPKPRVASALEMSCYWRPGRSGLEKNTLTHL